MSKANLSRDLVLAASLFSALAAAAPAHGGRQAGKCFGVAMKGSQRLRGGRGHHLRRNLGDRLPGQ